MRLVFTLQEDDDTWGYRLTSVDGHIIDNPRVTLQALLNTLKKNTGPVRMHSVVFEEPSLLAQLKSAKPLIDKGALYLTQSQLAHLSKLPLEVLHAYIRPDALHLLSRFQHLKKLYLLAHYQPKLSCNEALLLRRVIQKTLPSLIGLKELSLRGHWLDPRDWNEEYHTYEGALARREQAKDPADHDTTGIHAMLKGLISKGMKLKRLDLTGNNIMESHVPPELQGVSLGLVSTGDTKNLNKNPLPWYLP